MKVPCQGPGLDGLGDVGEDVLTEASLEAGLPCTRRADQGERQLPGLF